MPRALAHDIDATCRKNWDSAFSLAYLDHSDWDTLMRYALLCIADGISHDEREQWLDENEDYCNGL